MIYSLSHVTAVHHALSQIKEPSLPPEFDSSKFKEANFPIQKNFRQANLLFPWTESLNSRSEAIWYALNRKFCEKVCNESLIRMGSSYKIIYSIAFDQAQEVLDFNPSENKILMFAAHALRNGYQVEGAKETIAITCPSGQVRYVTLGHCNCRTFIKELKQKSPCIHLILAKAFIENRSVFKDEH